MRAARCGTTSQWHVLRIAARNEPGLPSHNTCPLVLLCTAVEKGCTRASSTGLSEHTLEPQPKGSRQGMGMPGQTPGVPLTQWEENISAKNYVTCFQSARLWIAVRPDTPASQHTSRPTEAPCASISLVHGCHTFRNCTSQGF